MPGVFRAFFDQFLPGWRVRKIQGLYPPLANNLIPLFVPCRIKTPIIGWKAVYDVKIGIIYPASPMFYSKAVVSLIAGVENATNGELIYYIIEMDECIRPIEQRRRDLMVDAFIKMMRTGVSQFLTFLKQ